MFKSLITCTNTTHFRSKFPAFPFRTISYHLPDELVAIHPASKRDESRLLSILPKQKPPSHRTTATKLYNHAKCIYSTFDACPTKLGDFQFKDITRLLPPQCHIFHNESSVLSARLQVQPLTGSTGLARSAGSTAGTPFEMLLLSPSDDVADPDAMTRAAAHGQQWRTMIRNDSVQEGDLLNVMPAKPLPNDGTPCDTTTHSVRVVRLHSPWIEEDEDDGVEADVEFIEHETTTSDSPTTTTTTTTSTTTTTTTMKLLLDKCGGVPIPPYFNREAMDSDAERYQTVFAAKHGSVAAPTAGLHFTEAVLTELEQNHVMSKVTLHVGAGTFKPVDKEGIEHHDMHRETWEITKDVLNSLIHSLSNDVPIIPVGTTSVRVLESLYWMGARTIANREQWAFTGGAPVPLALRQWEPQDLIAQYEQSNQLLPRPERAFEALLWEIYPAALGSFCLRGTTEICIAPGYEFRVVDGLVTNFHQSSSTLMYLTSAVLGSDERLLECYDHAIARKYRFLSYGDACFMLVQR